MPGQSITLGNSRRPSCTVAPHPSNSDNSASDAPASSQTPPPNRIPQTQQPLTTHFTPTSHLPLDPDLVIQPVIRTMSKLQLSDDDTDPPDLVNAALGAARALTFTTARRALSRPSGAATAPTPAPPALATAPNQHASNDWTPPHPNTSAGPTTVQPTTQLPLTATTNTTYAMVVAGELPPAPPPTTPPPLPTTANYGPPAQVEHDHEMAAQEEQTERTPIPVQPVHQPAPILAPPLMPAPIEDGQHNLTNPQLEAFLHFIEEDLLAIDTHTAPQDAYRCGSLTAFTTPPPGGFPCTHRTSNTVLVCNIAPTQLVTIFRQPNPVLIVLPHNWSG
ncbi:hypothetical protein NEOLEDRAFT_1181460 [Neolentinus lepideus HHB14362 ss-1]|uniref:Uncharacterized protein n=1 Tax=Neolentinus lepideus HHB14362 ss-1 TaxID=1314782 RepID=A0A165Q1H9_9AGAM|nr:hypothetical protein NEOLEDRAFT_1181460 [Neolentinus lepideus HHB14362 ss-1]